MIYYGGFLRFMIDQDKMTHKFKFIKVDKGLKLSCDWNYYIFLQLTKRI